MSPELVAALGAALVALITAFTNALQRRSVRQAELLDALDARIAELEGEKTELRTALRAADRWSGQLLRIIDRAGLDAPPAPDLTQGDDHDEPPRPLGDQGVRPAGRRRRADPDTDR